MNLFLKTPPRMDSFPIEEVEEYLKIPSHQDRAFLKTVIEAAYSYVEKATGRALLKQQWELHITPPYPSSSPLIQRREKELQLNLPYPPLLQVDEVRTGGKAVSFSIKNGKVLLPSVFYDQELILTYWAGYGKEPSSLPPPLKMAVFMAARMIYEGRKESLPLLSPFKVYRFM